MGVAGTNQPKGSLAPDPSPTEIAQHLEEVLSSTTFHSAQRSCQFLRYVVEIALAGHLELLKERSVGERVFGRSPDYDTGQDSIVRVKASEVRRRLAQYYDLHPEAPIRIELPSGAYSPAFHRGHARELVRLDVIQESIPHAGRPLARRRWTLRWVAATLAMVLLAAAFIIWRVNRNAPFVAFWEPFLSGQQAPIFCVPTPETYRIYGSGKAALIDALRPRSPGQPMPTFPAEQAAQVKIVSEPGDFLGIGDARALTLLYAFAVSHGTRPQIRQGIDTSFTELRAGPDLLIGGFTNHWTLDLLKDARFVFESENGVFGIRDRTTGKFVCRKPSTWEPRGTEDCAVVTRILHSKTGNPLMVAAGLDHFGTFEVGEFLTRKELLEPVLRTLPATWRQRNLQIVFRVEVLRDNVGPPQVLATHVW